MIATLALGLMLSAAPGDTSADVAAVREAHERYAKALLAKDGAAAAAAVDRASIAYYGRMLELALDGDPGTVRKQPVIDKVMILRLRHQVARERLEKMGGGAGLLAFGVENGWIDAKSVQTAMLGAIHVDGDTATGDLQIGGKTAPPAYSWQFHREGGTWRLSLLTLLRIAEPSVQQAVKQSGLDEDAFVLALTEKVSGKPVAATVWDPLRAPSERKGTSGTAR